MTVEKDHEFARIEGAALKLDLYRSPRTDAPVVLYVHGGGWRSGNKADEAERRLAPLAARRRCRQQPRPVQ